MVGPSTDSADQREGEGLQGEAPQALRAVRQTDRRQEVRNVLPALLASEPPRAFRSVSDLSKRPQDETPR